MLSGLAACRGDDVPALVTTTSRVVTTASPTTTAAAQVTTTAAPTTTVADPESTTTDPSPGDGAPGSEQREIHYQVVRQEATRDGIRLFVAISPGDYTEVDLENLVIAVYEERDNVYEVHVFDDWDAVGALVKAEAERTAEESELLDGHYLVSLLEGDTIRFQGPLSDLEGFRIGS
jgi:hypothetical protein